MLFFFFSSRRRHTRFDCDWSSDVCSSDLGNPEVVVDQETGLLVDERPRALATAIATMASNPSQRRTMGDAGRWRVKRHFTIERMVNDYAAAYQVSRTSVTPNAAAAPATLPADCDSKAETPIG